MKHLFIVRDGEYNHDYGSITRYGRLQIQNIGGIVREINNGGRIHIMSPPTKASMASALVLRNELGLAKECFEVHPYFYDFHNEKFPRTCNQAIHIIDRRRKLAYSLIIVSNIYTVRALVPYATFKYLDEVGIANTERQGTGMHIDLEKKICESIPKRE